MSVSLSLTLKESSQKPSVHQEDRRAIARGTVPFKISDCSSNETNRGAAPVLASVADEFSPVRGVCGGGGNCRRNLAPLRSVFAGASGGGAVATVRPFLRAYKASVLRHAFRVREGTPTTYWHTTRSSSGTHARRSKRDFRLTRSTHPCGELHQTVFSVLQQLLPRVHARCDRSKKGTTLGPHDDDFFHPRRANKARTFRAMARARRGSALCSTSEATALRRGSWRSSRRSRLRRAGRRPGPQSLAGCRAACRCARLPPSR